VANFAMPWVDADFRRKTTRLTKLQRNAYRDLLQACFDGNGILQDNNRRMAQICDIDLRTWRKHRPVLLAFFYQTADGWRHKRVDHDLARIAKIREQRSLAGQKGALQTAMRWYRKH